jgi:hypothetical protein
MKVKFLSGDKNASLKKITKATKSTKSTKSTKAKETPDQIKKRAGAFKVTNNLAYLNNRGPELPVNYEQYVAPTRLTVYDVTGVSDFQVRDSNGIVVLNNNGQLVSATISTIGRPIQIMACGDMNPFDPSGVGYGGWARLQLYRDSTPLGNSIQVESSDSNENQAYCLQFIDNPLEGTYTYYLQVVATGIRNFPGCYQQYGEAAGPVINVVELRN